MSLTKDQVCVFIENEEQLEAAKDLLNKYCQSIDYPCFARSMEKYYNYLKYYEVMNDWSLSCKDLLTIITLSELETILKAEHEALQKD